VAVESEGAVVGAVGGDELGCVVTTTGPVVVVAGIDVVVDGAVVVTAFPGGGGGGGGGGGLIVVVVVASVVVVAGTVVVVVGQGCFVHVVVVVGWQQGTVDVVFQDVVGPQFHVGGAHPSPCECRIN